MKFYTSSLKLRRDSTSTTEKKLKFHKVSWEELTKDCLELYLKIKHLKFDRILCISRGGLVWARMFSDLLNLPVSHITALSYSGPHQRGEVKITERPDHENIKDQTLLVIDEIGDHGKTLAAVNKFLILIMYHL